MFVLFNETVHIVAQEYTLTPATAPIDKKKRKRTQDTETIYILIDGDRPSRQIAVKSSDCTPLKIKMDYDFEKKLHTFLTKEYEETHYLKCSYSTSPDKSYYIESIDKIMKDGLMVSLRSGDIRHFKFDKLYMACGDYIISRYAD